MKIVLDFDDTLFNTQEQLEELQKIFWRAGFTEEEFWTLYQETKQKIGDFDVLILDLALQLKQFNREKVNEEINFLTDKSADFVYSDVTEFLNGFNKKDIILLSSGADFQKLKVKKSKLAPFFNEIIITFKDKVEELKVLSERYPNEKIFFIDDKAEQIDKVKNQLPQIITMKMERPKGRHLFPKSELSDLRIKNLSQAKQIINRIIKIK